ncbi:MAG: cytochrome-c peroxidase [Bryobacterales bacterium]
MTAAFTTLSALAGEPKLEPLMGMPPFPADNPPTPGKGCAGQRAVLRRPFRQFPAKLLHLPQAGALLHRRLFARWGLQETELRRKTPNLLNVGWQQSMFFDGREKTLEDQASKPLENPFEMGIDPAEAAKRIAGGARYRRMFEVAFPGEPITFDVIAKAIASYERTLVSNDSPLDRYLLGDETALSDEAKRGMALFEGKAGCIRCTTARCSPTIRSTTPACPRTKATTSPARSTRRKAYAMSCGATRSCTTAISSPLMPCWTTTRKAAPRPPG